MNRERIKYCINLMRDAEINQTLFMPFWQSLNESSLTPTTAENIPVADNLSELHSCGNKACLAGHIAISPLFILDGGKMLDRGEPLFMIDRGDHTARLWGSDAIAYWLDIPTISALCLVNGMLKLVRDTKNDKVLKFSKYYEKYWEEVTPADVIKKLSALLDVDAEEEPRFGFEDATS